MTAGRPGVAVITGGTGALGRAVVPAFARAGYRVHVPWLSEREAADLERGLDGSLKSQVRLHRRDVTRESDVQPLFQEIADAGEQVTVLANLVGGFSAAPVEETSPAEWERMMTLNVSSAFLCCRAAVPAMKRAGFGRIINVSSAPAVNRGAANLSAYSAAKAAVLNFTESLSRELVSSRITANAIVPSVIDTPANRQANPGADHSTWLKPAEIADVLLFLAGEQAGIVTGTALVLSRG